MKGLQVEADCAAEVATVDVVSSRRWLRARKLFACGTGENCERMRFGVGKQSAVEVHPEIAGSGAFGLLRKRKYEIFTVRFRGERICEADEVPVASRCELVSIAIENEKTAFAVELHLGVDAPLCVSVEVQSSSESGGGRNLGCCDYWAKEENEAKELSALFGIVDEEGQSVPQGLKPQSLWY